MPDRVVLLDQLNRDVANGRRIGSNINVQEAVIAFGHAFSGTSRPKEYRKRRAGNCFQNSFELSANGRGTYVEGYALPPNQLPAHHAWLTTNGKEAIDVTWPNSAECEYFGIVFPEATVRRWMFRFTEARNYRYGPLLDWEQPQLLDELLEELRHGETSS